MIRANISPKIKKLCPFISCTSFLYMVITTFIA
jgi:hypothetical protein